MQCYNRQSENPIFQKMNLTSGKKKSYATTIRTISGSMEASAVSTTSESSRERICCDRQWTSQAVTKSVGESMLQVSEEQLRISIMVSRNVNNFVTVPCQHVLQILEQCWVNACTLYSHLTRRTDLDQRFCFFSCSYARLYVLCCWHFLFFKNNNAVHVARIRPIWKRLKDGQTDYNLVMRELINNKQDNQIRLIPVRETCQTTLNVHT